MKKIFTLIALAVMAIAPKSAFAQEGITQTTYWNFDQFQAGNENVAFDTPVNYGGLYIVGHQQLLKKGKNSALPFSPESAMISRH